MFIDSIEKLGKYKYKVKTETLVFYAYQSDLKKYSIKEMGSTTIRPSRHAMSPCESFILNVNLKSKSPQIIGKKHRKIPSNILILSYFTIRII